MPDGPSEQQREAMAKAALENARAIGAAIAIPFVSLTIWLDGYILSRAQNGETTYGFGKGYAASFTLACIGISVAAGGPPVARFLQSLLTRKRNFTYWMMGLAVVSPGMIAYFWLQHRIALLISVLH